jgi:hypothetical protein
MKHVQVPPDGEVLPLDPTPADDDPLLATSNPWGPMLADRPLGRSP